MSVRGGDIEMNERRYVVGNGVVTDGMGVFYPDGALLIDDGHIVAVGASDELKKKGDSPWVDVGGRLILPGLTNMHHHLYSCFAPGIAPHGSSEDFIGILKELWWPLDAAMDREAVYWSALWGALDCLRHGVTTVFDHHASMTFVSGALDAVSEGIERAGIRAVLCLELSDRLGRDKLTSQFDENLRFWESHRSDPMRRGMLGLHANFTISDESMAYIGGHKPRDMAVHVHCGEGRADYDYCRAMGYHGPVHRLEAFGLLSSSALLAHCIHLSDEDHRILEELSPAVVTNPESNANNQVGSLDRGRIPSFLLGTDGMTGDMVASLRSAFLLGRQSPDIWGGLHRSFFSHRYPYVRRFFPDLRCFEIGSAADVAVLDYVPTSPIDANNVLGHLVFGARGGNAFMTVVGGKILWRDGVFADEELNRRESGILARSAARRLHDRFGRNPWSTYTEDE
ncbi:MAG: hypothetical protein CSA35_08035 [Dethiosulfovibrio peptidovorans]|nr:MAG: hypothetical protein CSA35_08035 [Dethiosulfovibrio peptidovorans]